MGANWTQYAPRMGWLLYSAADSGFLVKDTRDGKTYAARSLQEVDEIAADLSQLADYYGAGDLVHELSQYVGLERCGKCAQRHSRLNQLLPKLWPRK